MSQSEDDPLVPHIQGDDVLLDPEADQLDKKDNSVTVIFSLWSTMIGSTLLEMPKTFRQAGVYPGVPGLALMCAVMCYTGLIMVKCGKYYGRSTTQVLSGAFPGYVKNATLLVSVAIFVGAMSLYHVYLTQSVLAFANIEMSDTKWRIIVTLIITGLVFGVGALKSLAIIVRASSYCIVVIIFMIIFIIVQSARQLAKDECKPGETLVHKAGVGFAGVGNIAVLLSTLGVSLFCQNIMLSILSQTTRPSKTTRNCIIAWICTALSYGIPSVIATVAFSKCAGFEGDFIAMFNGWFADIARAAIILLVGVVYPLLLFASRTQVLSLYWGEANFPYWAHLANNGVTLAITSIPSLIHMDILLVGALVGLFGLYWGICVPIVSWIRACREQGTATPVFYAIHGGFLTFAAALMIITVLSIADVIKTGIDESVVAPPSNTTIAPLALFDVSAP